MIQVIYILWLRQLKRHLRSRSRVIGSLAQPLLFLVSFGFGFGPIFSRAGQGNYIQFLVPGIISMTIIFTALFQGTQVIWDKQFGFLKETLVAPVSRLEIMIGRTLGGATVSLIQGITVLAVSYLAGFRIIYWPLFPISLIFMFLIGLLFTSLGTAIASKLDDMQGFQLVVNFLVMPLFFLSGALFPLGQLPPVLKIIAALDPLSYGVDGLRASLLNASHYGLMVNLSVLLGVTALLTIIGAWLFSKIQL